MPISGAFAFSSDRRFEAFGSGFADVDGFGLEIERFHLDRKVIDAETIVQLSANYGEELGVRNGVVVTDVSG